MNREIVKFKFVPDEELVSNVDIYNVVYVDYNDEIIGVEDHNLTKEEIEELCIHLTKKGLPYQAYSFTEGTLFINSNCYDSEGQEIYEGDLVGFWWDKEEVTTLNEDMAVSTEIVEKSGYSVLCVVKINGCLGVVIDDLMSSSFSALYSMCDENDMIKHCKILGNVLINPELIDC